MVNGPVQRDAREVRGAWASFQSHWYADPAPDLAPFVSRYWFARWDLRGQPAYRQLIVPYPQVHLSVRYSEAAMVRGVARGHVVRVLRDAGQVFGVAFRPGGFRPFLGRSVATLTDRSIAARDVFGTDPYEMARVVDEESMVGAAERFLRERLPRPDATAGLVADIVARIAAEPGLVRVGALAESLGMSDRRVQRLFCEYVGVGPKWVIRRYRLHEVTERMAAGLPIDWAGLAAELGYADQAHLTRDFRSMVGEPPTRYADRYPVGGA